MRKQQNPAHHNQGQNARAPSALTRYRGWKLEVAKARFSEVVRRAQSEGPQRVTVRSKDAVVIISAKDLELLLPQLKPVPLSSS